MTEQSELIKLMYKQASGIETLYRFSQVGELWSDVSKQKIKIRLDKKTRV